MGDAIGGYFELELPKRGSFVHDDGVLLNSGRNALEYVLRSMPDVRHLWAPYYTCDSILEPITKLGIPYTFYHINERLELKDGLMLQDGDYLLYTNYFGIQDSYVKQLAMQYGSQLIVDNAQACVRHTLLVSMWASPMAALLIARRAWTSTNLRRIILLTVARIC